MNFTPDQTETKKVPFFEDTKREDGWQGHTTTKTVKRLMDEVKESLARLGGIVVSFQQGTFQIENQSRQGFQVRYVVEGMEARLNIAALPVKDEWNTKKKDQSLKMALYMLEIGLNGAWFMQILSPGYAPLIPMMLTENGSTISELWAKNSTMKNLLPAPETDFVAGVVNE